jgi:hypothetical protein
MPDQHHEPREADKSLLEALQTAIAEGDADLVAGRFRSYQAGDLVREMLRFSKVETPDDQRTGLNRSR